MTGDEVFHDGYKNRRELRKKQIEDAVERTDVPDSEWWKRVDAEDPFCEGNICELCWTEAMVHIYSRGGWRWHLCPRCDTGQGQRLEFTDG